jgi:hypothetical protein
VKRLGTVTDSLGGPGAAVAYDGRRLALAGRPLRVPDQNLVTASGYEAVFVLLVPRHVI